MRRSRGAGAALVAFVLGGVGCQVIGGLGELDVAGAGGGTAGAGGATGTQSSSASTGAGGDDGIPSVWSRRFGDASAQTVADVGVDESGNIYLVGSFAGTLDVGLAPNLVSAGDSDVFVVKLDPNGTPLWQRSFGGGNTDKAGGLSVTAGGNVLVTGEYVGDVSFGGKALAGKGGPDAFVVKLNALTGNLEWVTGFAGNAAQRGTAVTNVLGENTVFALGTFEATLTLGFQSFTSQGGEDLWVARLGSSGGGINDFLPAGSEGNQFGSALVFAQEKLVLAGRFEGELGTGSPVQSAGGFDAFVSTTGSANGLPWALRFGDAGDQRVLGLAANGPGTIAVGAFEGAFDVGGQPLASKGLRDGFVVSVDEGGAVQWARGIGDGDAMMFGVGDQEAADVAVGLDGSIFVTGSAEGVVDFGDGALVGPGDVDLFVVKLSPQGIPAWRLRRGGEGPQWGRGIAVDPQGNVIVAGDFQGTLDLGNGALTSAGSTDLFVAKLPPSP